MKKHEWIIVALTALALAGGMLASFMTFTERMAVVEVHLVTIQRDIAQIADAVDNREDVLIDLRKRVVQLETSVENMERRLENVQAQNTDCP